ncbi:MAG TPA: hypothetical protein VLB27_07740 [candidate division Zixibacteria bacterium]|nr:hypothetical protein [candidate division Zixibacteria bacterium]
MDTHEQTDADAAEIPALREYRVSEDFNTRLLNRIADERYAEVRSQAYLPKHAPHFTFAQAAPAFAAFALVAFVALNSLQSFPGADPAPANTASIAATEQAEPSLGAALGLSDEYLTVVPIDNPTYAGVAPASSRAAGAPTGATMVSGADNRYRYSTPGNWRFARELERAQRFIEISNSLGSGHRYFQIIQRNYQVAPNVIVGSTTLRFGTIDPSQTAPQIIIHQSPTESISPRGPQSPAGRVVGGSF